MASLSLQPPPTKKKRRENNFTSKYSEEFSFIAASSTSPRHAFCKVCRKDINIAHGGRSDINQHIKSSVHMRNTELEHAVQESSSLKSYFSASAGEDYEIIRAECLFTAFFIEHNVALTAADHIAPLLRKAFPKSEEIKKYASGRTKTTCIMNEMACHYTTEVSSNSKLQKLPYAISTDGSHTSDSKLYPIVVSYPDHDTKSIKLQLTSVPSLELGSTGVNIGNLVISELEKLKVPIENCLAMGSDNAPVMLGKNQGVISVLRQKQPHMIALGCPCHLINIAAQNAAKMLPIAVDSLLIDLFYYMEGSVNRKHRLKEFQVECGEEIRKVLKHVCTRWLSLGQCLPRLTSQWETITRFIDEEVGREKAEQPKLSFQSKSYKIPKKTTDSTRIKAGGVKEKNEESKGKKIEESKGKKIEESKGKKTEESKGKKIEESKGKKTEECKEKKTDEKRVVTIQRQLHNDMCRAYANFLLFSIRMFEKTNVSLQTREPLIHVLKPILMDFLKEIQSCFLKPSVILSSDPLYIDHKNRDLYRDNVDIRVGSSTLSTIEKLGEKEREEFYEHVKNYYMAACEYIISSFNLKSDILHHAQVADTKKKINSSFSSVRFFSSNFPILVLKGQDEEGDQALDALEEEFSKYQVESFPPSLLDEPVTKQWFAISEIKDPAGKLKYERLAFFMLGLLTIPHSNSECERIFSLVRKNKTDFQGSLKNETLSNLLITKSYMVGKCHEQEFSRDFLKAAKGATKAHLSKDSQN